MDLRLTKGDNVTLVIVLRGDDGNPLDLTGYTATLHWRIGGGRPRSAAMSVVDAAAGKVQYTFTDNDLYDTGQLEAEVVISDGTNDVASSRFRGIVVERIQG